MSILDKITAYKREEIAAAKKRVTIRQLQTEIANCGPPRGFRDALLNAKKENRYGLIAEIKKASPSKGIIRQGFEPNDHAQLQAIARAYKEGGASCLSVLTDEPSFQGHLAYIFLARVASGLPALRKDFMLDPYQVVEARAYNADCILIIMAMTDDVTNHELLATARDYGMDALVEVHNKAELDRALKLGANMIGINNRDLRSFVTDLGVTLKLAPLIPPNVLTIAESGLDSAADLARLAEAGVTSVLVGESLMREADVEAATRRLLSARITP